jgi:hypothetical protein
MSFSSAHVCPSGAVGPPGGAFVFFAVPAAMFRVLFIFLILGNQR